MVSIATLAKNALLAEKAMDKAETNRDNEEHYLNARMFWEEADDALQEAFRELTDSELVTLTDKEELVRLFNRAIPILLERSDAEKEAKNRILRRDARRFLMASLKNEFQQRQLVYSGERGDDCALTLRAW